MPESFIKFKAGLRANILLDAEAWKKKEPEAAESSSKRRLLYKYGRQLAIEAEKVLSECIYVPPLTSPSAPCNCVLIVNWKWRDRWPQRWVILLMKHVSARFSSVPMSMPMPVDSSGEKSLAGWLARCQHRIMPKFYTWPVCCPLRQLINQREKKVGVRRMREEEGRGDRLFILFSVCAVVLDE